MIVRLGQMLSDKKDSPGRPAFSLEKSPLNDEPMSGGFVCSQCGSQLGKTLPLKCPNCGKIPDGSEVWQYTPQKGEYTPTNMQVNASVHMPTNHKLILRDAPVGFHNRSNNSLSDEFADNLDEDHLESVASSADSLAL